MTSSSAGAAPALGQAALPAESAAALLRRNAADPAIRDRPAVRFDDLVISHAEYYRASCRWANLFLRSKRPDRPLHVGVLLDNVPEYLYAFGGAALAGAAIVGVNHTRSGEHLLHDVRHTHCDLVVYEPGHYGLIAPVLGELDNVLVVGESLDDTLSSEPDSDPHAEVGLEQPWALIFTSGTAAAPKAVICSQRRILVTGNRMAQMMGIGLDDVGYVSMPLFHSNSVMVGWAPSIVVGASVGLARKFTASGWLGDVRRYGATYFNYTGKPLAYILAQPEGADDADNTLRVAYGNEGAPQVVGAFAERFGVHVIDAFGATEGGLAVTRIEDAPPGSVGRAGPELKIFGEDGRELPRATFDDSGTLVDPVACVGEIVNTSGIGVFEGYYNNEEANQRATRNGWYWSGDLGYLDAEGFLYFAGRTADWIRVDGENFPVGPIETVVARHPDVLVCVAYGVPDPEAGDRVMMTLVMRSGAAFDPVEFAAWIDGQADLSPKWRPTHIRVSTAVPTSPTNKVLTRTLVHQKYRPDRTAGDEQWVRTRGDAAYRVFGPAEADELHRQLRESGRERFWDL
ncbi:MAG TPA: AMP-binding protein [Acidimicrobiales bacterium]|nr:AMP-binding protein [Acidimicrobiales bacterium]